MTKTQQIDTCPTCGKPVEDDLYLGWLVDPESRSVVANSPTIFHTGTGWCGGAWAARFPGTVPCDMPVEDPEKLADRIARTYGDRIGAVDAQRLRELARQIAAHQRASNDTAASRN